MDLYIWSMLLGAVGLGSMALAGFGHGHGHSGGGHGSHGHGGSHGDAGHVGHANGHGGHAGHAAHGHHSGHATNGHHNDAGHHGHGHSLLWSLASPRILFSLALGFGATGGLVEPFLNGPLRLVVAIAGGILFERAIFSPLWNFLMRFASTPALTLESAVTDEATAVTSFDANGQGIVSVEVDGQIVQILATLQSTDQSLGVRVRAGQRLRIEEVHATSNRCTVSLL